MSELVEHICRVLTLCDLELSKNDISFDSHKASDREIRTFLRYKFPRFYYELIPLNLEPCAFLSHGLKKMSRLSAQTTEVQRYTFVRNVVTNIMRPPDPSAKKKKKSSASSEVGTYISETTFANQQLNDNVIY